MSNSADGWTHCDLGHRHWGLAGAAGLLVVHTHADGVTRVLLQHRSAHVQHGLTWAIPGGALEHGEAPDVGALREAREELSGIPNDLATSDQLVDDHGGWSYTTVLARTPQMFDPGTHGWETSDEGYTWAPVDSIAHLDLHPGFGATWSAVRARLQ
jgi:8-oxo-dGTP diphosphatase